MGVVIRRTTLTRVRSDVSTLIQQVASAAKVDAVPVVEVLDLLIRGPTIHLTHDILDRAATWNVKPSIVADLMNRVADHRGLQRIPTCVAEEVPI